MDTLLTLGLHALCTPRCLLHAVARRFQAAGNLVKWNYLIGVLNIRLAKKDRVVISVRAKIIKHKATTVIKSPST